TSSVSAEMARTTSCPPAPPRWRARISARPWSRRDFARARTGAAAVIWTAYQRDSGGSPGISSHPKNGLDGLAAGASRRSAHAVRVGPAGSRARSPPLSSGEPNQTTPRPPRLRGGSETVPSGNAGEAAAGVDEILHAARDRFRRAVLEARRLQALLFRRI